MVPQTCFGKAIVFFFLNSVNCNHWRQFSLYALLAEEKEEAT